MADCICHADLKHIRHDGNFIGDDWTYTIRVNGEEKEITGNGKDIEFTPPTRWTVVAGECGAPTVISIQATAVEDDLFFDDVGSAIRHIKQDGITEGGDPVHVKNVAVRARVVETGPIWFTSGGTNFVDFLFDLEYVSG